MRVRVSQVIGQFGIRESTSSIARIAHTRARRRTRDGLYLIRDACAFIGDGTVIPPVANGTCAAHNLDC